jgi:hypothetical protein
MARRRFAKAMRNVGYSALGLATAGAIGYAIYRARKRRESEWELSPEAEGSSPSSPTSDAMLDLRRSTREAGRQVKDSVSHAAKDSGRALKDVGRSASDVVDEATTGYGRP